MYQTPTLSPAKKKILTSLGLTDGKEILLHYPYRYDTFIPKDFSAWKIGEVVIFSGELVQPFTSIHFGKGKTMSKGNLRFEDTLIQIVAFNQPWLAKWQVGSLLTVVGKYDGHQKVTASKLNQKPLNATSGIHPVYSLKEGITSEAFQKIVKESYDLNQNELKDVVPGIIRQNKNFLSFKDAVYEIHFPSDSQLLQQAIRTLKYEEFFKFALIMNSRKRNNQNTLGGHRKDFSEEKVKEKENSLPFKLTKDQKQALKEILKDLSSETPMYRLLEGDVGSGKTIVAALGMYACCLAGYQCAIMAPTEILAKQHERTFSKFFKDTPYKGGILTSSLDPETKNEVLSKLRSGEYNYIVGTHALFQESVQFKNLGFVITDEQQRFGVKQRQAFSLKGQKVDVLMLSATPIPRTLAGSLFGDMDLSIIESMPEGRHHTITKYIPENSIRLIKKQLEDLMSQGNQLYIVCPAINLNEKVKMRNVTQLAANLKKEWAGKFRVAEIHGQLDTAEKEKTMEAFRNHQYDVLVSTTVIEVGVDIPQANIMVIYEAQRFGLSQLHQLRGRVGRNSQQGYCFLLSSDQSEETQQRLQFLADNTDGFKIAAYDLSLRGPGDLLGLRQSGIPGFILGDLVKDNNILTAAQKDANLVLNDLNNYPEVEEYLQNEGKQYIKYFD